MITNGINQEEADKISTGIANTIRNNKRLIRGDNNNRDRKTSFQQMEDASRRETGKLDNNDKQKSNDAFCSPRGKFMMRGEKWTKK